MHAIDKVVINFDEGQLFLLNICLAFLMFGISLDLSLRDFRTLLKTPKAIIVGLSSQLVLLPLVTLILIYIWQPPPSVQMGMMMVAVCPGGNVSNYLVHRSGGNTALSITLTSIVTITAVLITPLSFYAFTSVLPASSDTPIALAIDILSMIGLLLQIVVIPLIAGMTIYRYFPVLRNKISRSVKIFSIFLLLSIIIVALTKNASIVIDYAGTIFLLVLTHNALAFFTGYSFATLNDLNFRDRKAVTIETGIQNSGLGLILIFNYFHGQGGMAVVAAWWGVWHLISGFILSTIWSRRKKQEEEPYLMN